MAIDNRPAEGSTGDRQQDVFGIDVTVYNRPARVRRIYGETAKVVWDDVGTIGFVTTDQLEGRASE